MRDLLISATEAAICNVDATRFFQTERGFHGRFYCALQEQIDHAGLIANGAILEMEYQKSARHGLGQRPDIIFHIPAEHSHAAVNANNFAVWALKRRASAADARNDFVKLDQMFDTLHYRRGFFVNIDATDPMREHYTGIHGDRLVTVAVSLDGAHVGVHWAGASAEA
jgi:choline dehydrogenase-like flavoprotein